MKKAQWLDKKIQFYGAHQDDEAFFFGGTAKRSSQSGGHPIVVFLTQGEKGSRHIEGSVEEDALIALRRKEAFLSNRILGVKELVRWKYPDGGLVAVPEAEIVPHIELLILQDRPDVVITFGVDRIYPHKDHIATQQFVTKAVMNLYRKGAFAGRLYYAVFPRELDEYHMVMRKERNTTSPLYADIQDAAPYLADLEVVELSDEHRECKYAALRAHASQNPENFIKGLQSFPPELQHEFFLEVKLHQVIR